jgi:hypothetical protein
MDLMTLGMEFASEMVIKATLLNMRVTEVPTSLWPDGRSRPPHLRPWRDGWRHLRFMLLFSPNWLFLYPGLLTMILGITLVIILSRGSLSIGGVNFDVNTLIYSAFASIIGFQAVLFSILSRIYAVQNRLYPNTGGFLKFSDWFSLESGVILGFFIALAGFVGAIFSFQEWNHQNFGNLDLGVTSRHVIPSAMAMSLGSETILFSLFQSCLSLSLLHSSPAKNGFRGD